MTTQGRTKAERSAVELGAHIRQLVEALTMIEQGYVFQGGARFEIDAKQMQDIARKALS